jgi:hypothetical protein
MSQIIGHFDFSRYVTFTHLDTWYVYIHNKVTYLKMSKQEGMVNNEIFHHNQNIPLQQTIWNDLQNIDKT